MADVHKQLRSTDAITHPGEKGRAREEVIRLFLRSFVPKQFGVDTGFVVDAHGNVSLQLDIIIHRTDYHPVFEIGGLKYFMIESVAAVFQNRSDVASVASLHSALENLRSVKRLDRTGGGHNYIVMDFHGRGPDIDASSSAHSVFTGVIAQRSLAQDTFAAEYGAELRAQPKQLWPNLYVDVERFCTVYLRRTGPGANDWALVNAPEVAERIGLTGPEHGGAYPPLADLAHLLAARLRSAATIDYDPAKYFPWNTKHREIAAIPNETQTGEQ